MNWKATGSFLTIVGIAAALLGWWWSHSIHLERQDCRLANLFGGGGEPCPSKVPAIVLSSAGGVIIVLGIALLVGAATSAQRK
jgi:uncharacterized membrane protein YidH (DUF202 family)